MFVRTTDHRPGPNTLGELGFGSAPDTIVSPIESTYRKGAEIFGEGEPAEYVYQVKRGAVRTYKLLLDGRRQIAAFHLPGDIFGVESGQTNRFTAEAVVETAACLITRDALRVAADQDMAISRNLLHLTTNNLEHAENHMLLLGRKTSVEKVAAFLVEMHVRTGADKMSLPMTRRDIADYLGLTIETVSRALARFRKAGVLTFDSVSHREIMLLDGKRLASFDPQT